MAIISSPDQNARRRIETIVADIGALHPATIYGSVTKILGLLVEITGFPETLSLGARVTLAPDDGRRIPCEVVGFKDSRALVMPFGPLGISAVAHRLLYRREDRANPEIIAFVDWITGMLAQERNSDWR